mmetsp:Transcript_46542/g.101301  ORF Transcript_46542/g.101301 Transcript_46542/m.101301 type:complete len:80 (+) Transcript_46542:697-936(+)
MISSGRLLYLSLPAHTFVFVFHRFPRSERDIKRPPNQDEAALVTELLWNAAKHSDRLESVFPARKITAVLANTFVCFWW